MKENESARRPALLVVVRGAEDYGVATELLNFVRAFSSRGWAVTVYTLGTGGFLDAVREVPGVAAKVDSNVPRRFIAGRRSGRLMSYTRLLWGSIGFVRNLNSHLRYNRYDALIFCEPGLVLPVAAALLGNRTPAFWLMPNIVSANYPFDINRRLYAGAFAMSGMVPVANSSYTRKTLGRGERFATQIDLGVDPGHLSTGHGGDPLAGRVPDGAIRLLVAARLIRKKGQLALLAGMLADDSLSNIHLILCGGPLESRYQGELRTLAQTRGASDRLHLIGPVSDVAAYYRACDVVASTRIDPEPFGLSIVEAMIMGRPVLAHALGGPGDIVVDGETGWLLSDMRRETVSAGLRRMIDARSQWPAMGEAGRKRALAHYTVDSMTDQLIEVFARHGVDAAACKG